MRSLAPRVLVRMMTGIALLAGLHACGDSGNTVGPGPETEAKLVLSAAVAGTPIAVVTAEVTAADIAVSLRFNLPITNGIASGTLKLPPGTARLVTVRAFDQTGAITHEGSVTVDIRAGQNPPVRIVLRSRAGQLPITATLGEISVVVTPGTLDLAVGATSQLTATVLDADGNPVEGTVEWAVANPAFVSVSPSGLAAGLLEGETPVTATFEGVAGEAIVTVLPADVSGLYAGTASSTVTGSVSGFPISLGSDVVLGCTSPCAASLDLTQTGPTGADGTIVVGSRSFSGSFSLATVSGGLVLTAAAVPVSFNVNVQSPLGTIVVPMNCTVDASGGIALDPTPAGLSAAGALPVSCSGSGGGLSVTASGTVTLDLTRTGG